MSIYKEIGNGRYTVWLMHTVPSVLTLHYQEMFFSKRNGISGLLASVWSISCCRCRQFSLGHVLPAKTPPLSELEGPVPPKKPVTAYTTYCSERYKDSKVGKLSLSTIGREWREMSPQKKARYQEDFQRRREEYQKQMKEFSQNFACKTDQILYLLSNKKRGKATALSAMKKDRASKLPSEERVGYVLHKAKEDYKNLTSSELQTYQHIADNVNKESKKYHTLHKTNKVSVFHAMYKERTANRSVEEVANYWKKAKREYENLSDSEVRAYEELADNMSGNNWHKYIDGVYSKPRKVSVYHVMMKERAAKLPKEDRSNYVLRLSNMEYKNLSVLERQEYQKIADDLYRKRIKIYEAILRGCENI